MKEDVFRGLIETFVEEMRERTHGDHVLVVLVKCRINGRKELETKNGHARLQELGREVNLRFRRIANNIIEGRPSSEDSDVVYPEDFLEQHDGKPWHVHLSRFSETVDIIDAAHVVPYISHAAFDPLYSDWMRLTGCDLAHSCAVCIDWDVTYPHESRFEVMNVEDFAMRKLTRTK